MRLRNTLAQMRTLACTIQSASPRLLMNVGDTLLERTVRNEILHWVRMPGTFLAFSSDDINRTVHRALRINRGSATERAGLCTFAPNNNRYARHCVDRNENATEKELPAMSVVKTCAAMHTCATCGESFSEKWCLRRHRCTDIYSKKRQRHW